MHADSPFEMFSLIPILEFKLCVFKVCITNFTYVCFLLHLWPLFFPFLPWHVLKIHALQFCLFFLICSSISQECTEVKAAMQNEKNLVLKFQNNDGIIFTTTKCSIFLNVVLKHCWYLSHDQVYFFLSGHTRSIRF